MGASIGKLPNFLAVGPPRTATTWLYFVLRGKVGLPRGFKETEFFLRYYGKGIDWYRAHFDQCPPDLPAGEVCPTYFASPEARNRIARHIPDCRIIITLRDPVDRFYSHYRLLRREGWIGPKVTLEEIIRRHIRTASGAGNLFDVSRYSHHVKAWRESFGEENVTVLFYEDLEDNPQKFLARVCRFIGVDVKKVTASPFTAQKINSVTHAPRSRRLARAARSVMFRLREHRIDSLIKLTTSPRLHQFVFEGGEKFAELKPSTERWLRQYFQPEIVALERMLKRDLSSWKGNAESNDVESVSGLPG